MMQKFIFIGCLFLSGICINAQLPKSLPAGLDKHIEKVLATFNVPGVAVSIVQDGKVLLTKGYGVKRSGTTEKVDENTLFLIASNSKAFTATALAMLVEAGSLKWDDRVIDYLPWFRMHDEYVTAHLTIRDLLVHHSGLPAYAGDAMLFPPSNYSRREILEKLKLIPLAHEFRTTYAYDNILYLAAGEVIAAVSGISWEDFVKTRILNKLGMERTIARYSLLKNAENVAVSHARSLNEVKVSERFLTANIGDAGNPAGGIVSTAADMARWLMMHLDSGRISGKDRLFKPATTAELWRVVRPIPVNKVPDYLKPMQSGFFGYSLGFRTYNYKEYQVVGHGGALRGFVSQIAMVPELNLGIAVLTNQSSTAAYWSIIYQVLDHFTQSKSFDWISALKRQQDSAVQASISARKKWTLKKDSVQLPGLPLKKYEGLYSDQLLGPITIRMEKQSLVMKFDNSPHFIADLEPFQYNTFIARFRNSEFDASAYLNFTIGPNGSVENATLKVLDPGSQMDFDDMHLKPVQHKKMDSASLHAQVIAETKKLPQGTFAVAFRDLQTGKSFFLKEKEQFHAASTMKTPVLIETFRQAAEGKFNLDGDITIKNEFKSIVDSSLYSLTADSDSDQELYTKTGQKMPLRALLHRMITQSSNLATNIVIDLVGAANANKTMRQLGASDIRVLRGVEDTKAFQAGLNNTTTAYDLMLIMEALATGKAVDKHASEEMIRILLDQQHRDIIPKKLPADVKVASKTGSITAVAHDSGIIFLPDGRKYVLVLLSKGVTIEEEATNCMANISRLFYDYMTKHG